MRRTLAVAIAISAAACSDDDPRVADTGTDPVDLSDATDATDATDVDADATTDPGEGDAPDADAGGDVADAETGDVGDTGAPRCRTEPGEVLTYELGSWTLSLDDGDGSWAVTPPHAEAAVFRAPRTCVEEGRTAIRVATGAPRVVNEFGAFRISLEGPGVAMAWSNVLGPPTPVVAGDGRVELGYAVDGSEEPLRLAFTATGGDLRIELEGEWAAGEIAWMNAPDEDHFGLGSQVTGMSLSRRTYPLWTQEQGNGKPENPAAWPLQGPPEAAYAPMGVWHSSAGWSAIVTHDAYSEIDLGDDEPTRSALRSYAALPGFVLVAGATPRERLTSITGYTGRLTHEPAPWTFGSWNDSVGGGERLREVAGILRDNRIPSSAIWSEDWIGGSEGPSGYRLSYAWEWDPTGYPDLPDDIDWLHENGFAFLAYFNTFVPQPTRMFAEGEAGRYLLRRADGTTRTVTDPAFRQAGLVDLSNPDAVAWFRSYLDTAAVELGIDGWMADFTEWAPVDVTLHDGSDPWLYHNRFPLLFQQLVSAALREAHAEGDEPSNNWSYFARSGWASVNGGTAGVAPTMWGGDQNTNWAYDDGYPTVIPIATHLGLSGVAIFGSDIGGYNALFGEPTGKELFMRWAAMAAFHPLMRTHHGSSECANWSFDRDPETLLHYRRYASIHSHLYEVFRGLALESQRTGLPIVRHPWLVEPDAAWLWKGDQFQFFVGDDLLVAPVLQQGADTRVVRVPGEGWWPLFGSGPAETTSDDSGAPAVRFDAPATELPVLVRPGTVLPLLAETVQTFYGDAPPGVTGLDDVSGLRLALYPAADGSISAEVRGVEVTATGLGAFDPADARIGGEALPVCADEAPTASCRTETPSAVLIVGSARVEAGGAVLELSADEDDRSWIAIGGEAWYPWATPTPLTELDPEVPPPCEAE